MAFDFPASPAFDQLYTQGGVSFVWNGYAWVTTASGGVEPTDFVLKAGDTMTGALTLPGDPVTALNAAPKQYVDAKGVPTGGTVGQALVVNASGVPAWGAAIDGGTF